MRTIRLCILFLSTLSIVMVSCQKDTFEENKVPVVDAGTPQTITLPVDSVKVTGTGTDADGKVVAYLWSQVSGPAKATIINPGSPATTIKGFITGSYIFQLMVTDEKGATGVDTVSVLVNGPMIKTLTLQPANNPNEMVVAIKDGANESGSNPISLEADAWTYGGGAYNLRGFVKFDLSSIPANATIISADLYLYSNPTPGTGNMIDANFGSDNTFLVQQVSAAWSTSTTTWFNQPAGLTANQVIVPSTTQKQLDLDLDVKNMVASMVSSNANYGFLIKLQTETYYNSRIFVGSRNATYPTKHPKLVVVYQ